MTNKTITLSRELAERVEYLMRTADIDPPCIRELRAALAEPVPPAGGGPEACCEVSDEKYNRVRFYRQTGDTTKPYHAPGEKLYDQACVSRLQAEAADVSKSYEALAHVYAATQKGFEKMQAERDALKAELRKTNLTNQDFVSQIRDLQAELTKARELFHRAQAADTAERHHLPYNVSRLMDDIEAWLQTSQSAPADKAPPLIQALHANGDRIAMEATIAQQAQRIADLEADKGQGEPVDVESEMLKAFSTHAEQFTFRNHPATPAMFPKGFPWFKAGYELGRAEQPAPVAVVLPEHHDSDLRSPTYGFARGWNACLDEVARLNSEPKP